MACSVSSAPRITHSPGGGAHLDALRVVSEQSAVMLHHGAPPADERHAHRIGDRLLRQFERIGKIRYRIA